MTDTEKIKSALFYIPSDDRDIWLQVGMAIHSEFDDAGFYLWDEWSQLAASYNHRDAESVWKSFSLGGGINIGSLFHLAGENGWKWEGPTLSREEIAQQRADIEARNKKADERRHQNHQDAARLSKSLWNAGQSADDNQYLSRKQCPSSENLRQLPIEEVTHILGYRPTSKEEHLQGEILLVPIVVDGQISTIEMIDQNGLKSAVKNGKKSGGYWAAQKIPADIEYNGTLIIGEGVATVLSAKEATGFNAVAALSCHNLRLVSTQFRGEYPKAKIIILADIGNGQKDAQRAASETESLLAIPKFPEGAAGSDFNDLAAAVGLDVVKRQIEAAAEPKITEKNNKLRVVKGCDVKPEPIEWLWPGWLAAGKLHILAGAPGTGKTTIAGNLAATMTQGGKWPDGSQSGRANIAIWSGEDDANDTLAPRMIAARADMSRVRFIQGIDTEQESRPFDPATDMQDLRQYLLKHPEIKLLIVDPVVSAVSGDSHKNTEVRRSLQPLVDLGQECHCAIFGISHFSKGTGGKDPVERVTGSIAFGALPRIVLAAAKIEDDSLPEGTRLFARAKSNIGPDSGGWHYRLNTTELKEYQDVFTSEVLWGDEVEGSARELLAAADSNDEDGGSALEEAKAFLQDELSLRPVAVNKIKNQSRKAGISDRTLQRAKKALKVKAEKGGFDEGWRWVLPEICMKDAKHHEEGQQKRVAPFGNVGTLREEITKNDEQVLILKDDDFIFDEPIQEVLI